MSETPEQNTEAAKSKKRRNLASSPEFVDALRKYRLLDPEDVLDPIPVSTESQFLRPSMSTMDVADSAMVTGPVTDLTARSPLSEEDLDRIAVKVQAYFRSEIRVMVKEITESMVQDITSGVVNSLRDEVAELRAENNSLKSKVDQLKTAADVAEQYSRRNCLRISGFKESETESTDTIVLDLARELDVELSLEEIDRSYRVGKKTSKARDIIVKFVSYRSRNRFYRARVRGKDTPALAKVYVNEDLTRKRNHILYECRQLFNDELVAGTWSFDGNIFIKDKANKVHRIDKVEDLVAFN